MNPREREKSSQSYEFPPVAPMGSPEEISLSTEIQRRISGIARDLHPRLDALVAGVVEGPLCTKLMPSATASLRRAVVAQVSACPRELVGFADRLCTEIQHSESTLPPEALCAAAAKHFGPLESEANGLTAEIIKINELATRFVKPNMGLVRLIVKSICPASVNQEDLWQEGAIALRAAALRYEPGSSAKFATFAFKAVRNHLIDVLRGSGCLTDYGARNLQEFAFAKETLFHRLGRNPTQAEVFAELGWSAKRCKSVSGALALAAPSSINFDGESFGQREGPISNCSPHDSLVMAEELERLNAALNTLSQDEAAVIKKRYIDGRSLRDIARRDGRSSQKIGELHQLALNKLRRAQPDAQNELQPPKGV